MDLNGITLVEALFSRSSLAVANGTYDPNIPIHSSYPLIRIFLEQFACDELFQSKNDPIFTSYADGCAAVFYRFHGVLDLEVAAIGGEDGVGEVVACAY